VHRHFDPGGHEHAYDVLFSFLPKLLHLLVGDINDDPDIPADRGSAQRHQAASVAFFEQVLGL
jgi:hypothetical protein